MLLIRIQFPEFLVSFHHFLADSTEVIEKGKFGEMGTAA